MRQKASKYTEPHEMTGEEIIHYYQDWLNRCHPRLAEQAHKEGLRKAAELLRNMSPAEMRSLYKYLEKGIAKLKDRKRKKELTDKKARKMDGNL
jgi:hypothetical protein